MNVITIRKQKSNDSFLYEIDDFSVYAAALQRNGIEAPPTPYRITLPCEVEQALRDRIDLNEQIAHFFRLGSTLGLRYAVQEQAVSEVV